MSLSPDKYPPKVINLFEAAKEEMAKAPPALVTAQKKKGGGGKTALIVLGFAAAGGGVALAAGRGGRGTPAAHATPHTRPTDPFMERMTPEEYCRSLNFTVQRNGY